MTYTPECDWQLEIARRLVRKDHRQRWVYCDAGQWRISETAIPYKDAISVYWMAIQQCVAYRYRPRVLAHSEAIDSVFRDAIPMD